MAILDLAENKIARTISVIVPALNEEANIARTYLELQAMLADQFEDYEILVFNDASTDNTGAIIDELAKNDPRLRAIHNPINMGIGYNYLTGIKISRMNYSILIPGDNEYIGASIKKMFEYIGHADIITSFSVNMESRPYSRRILSRLYTLMINALFDLELNYYNGAVIHRKDILNKINVSTFGFAYQSLILTQLLRSGQTFIEVGIFLRPRKNGKSTALKLKNIINVLFCVAKHWIKLYFRERQKFNVPGKRVLQFYGAVAAETVEAGGFSSNAGTTTTSFSAAVKESP